MQNLHSHVTFFLSDKMLLLILLAIFYFINIFQGTMKLSDTKSTESTQFSIISTSIGFFHCDVVEITLRFRDSISTLINVNLAFTATLQH